MKKRLLEICGISSGADGTWTRVLEEAKRLSEDYEILIVSSNLEKGKPIKKTQEKIDNIKIKRFPVKFKIGYALWFDFEKEAMKFKPDVIIAHGFRKPYLESAIKIKKKMNAKLFLATHAPFVEKKLRSWKLNTIIYFYDKFHAKKILNSFDKIFSISKWEIPFLIKKGANKDKIKFTPNGVSKEMFLKEKKAKTKNGKILFFGRIDPIKDIETLIKALSKVKEKYTLDITGPGEERYITKLKEIASKLNVKVEFNPPVYKLEDKIKKIDSAEIFVLPSKSEGAGIALIEAMARGKLCIASKANGPSELIEDKKTGFLFDIGNEKELAEKISFCLKNKNSDKIKSMQKRVKEYAKKYSWDKIIDRLKKEINLS
ncbi:MAG: glycosyltransferase family 4 protein [Candidatus Pacearchaeota archaeon]|jgi:galacturonosyltransferase